MDKKTKKLIENLDEAIKEKDNEKVHAFYDTIILNLAGKAYPKIVKDIEKKIKNIEIWYA